LLSQPKKFQLQLHGHLFEQQSVRKKTVRAIQSSIASSALPNSFTFASIAWPSLDPILKNFEHILMPESAVVIGIKKAVTVKNSQFGLISANKKFTEHVLPLCVLEKKIKA
jgi:hypothetical protein